jgi:malate dehydrogenase
MNKETMNKESSSKYESDYKHTDETNEPYVVLITGAAGNIGYTISFMIGQGRMFGPDREVILHLLDIPAKENDLKGLAMELEDCSFDLLRKVVYTSDPEVAFNGIDFALLCGAKPRLQGMERKDLLKDNAKIFEHQGKIINKVAKKTVKICVVGNPANTNALILLKNAPTIDPKNVTCLTRLDQNRLVNQISQKINIPNKRIKNLVIWGNHSTTQYPNIDLAYVEDPIRGTKTPLRDLIKDEKWIENDLIKNLQNRGGAIIEARKMSSVGSAANAICDHVRDWVLGTKEGEVISMGVYSNGEYGAPKDIIFSFPVTTFKGEWKIVDGFNISPFSKEKLQQTTNELLEEREIAFST